LYPEVASPEMDVLQWLPEYRMLVCKRCGVAMTKEKLSGHLMQHSSSFATPKLIYAFTKKILPTILDAQILDPSKEPIVLPAPDREALPGLKVIRGFGCNHCPFVSKNLSSIQRRFNESHAAVRRRRGGLRSYASQEGLAFPQITQIAACCTTGTCHVFRLWSLGYVTSPLWGSGACQLSIEGNPVIA
jgi:hypothetical protein